jgi:hypothetical protein
VRRKRKTELPATSTTENPACPFAQVAGSARTDSSTTCRLNAPRLLFPSNTLKLAGAPSPSVSNGVLTRVPENVALNGSRSSAWAIVVARLQATMRLTVSLLIDIALPPALAGGLVAVWVVMWCRPRAPSLTPAATVLASFLARSSTRRSDLPRRRRSHPPHHLDLTCGRGVSR